MGKESSTLNKKPNYTVDVHGTISPFSLLKVSLVFQKMKPFEVVEVLGCDLEMQKDLLRLLPNASYEVISAESPRKKRELAKVRIRKESDQPPDNGSNLDPT